MVLLLATLLPFTLAAQSGKFVLDSDFLARGEVRVGGNQGDPESMTDDFAAFIIGRTRLSGDYQWFKDTVRTLPRFQLRFTGQYAGIWGNGDSSALSVYEAWLRLNWKPGFFVQLGRQNLVYDDHRIFGSDDWSMTGLSHDILKAGLERAGHKLHFIFGFNQNGINTLGGTYYTGGLQPYKALEAFWYHYDFQRIPLGVSFLFANMGMQGKVSAYDPEQTYQQQIFGPYVNFHPGKWKLEGAYYRQSGQQEDGLPLDAWMASGKLSFTASGAFAFQAGYDYLSGDENFAVPARGTLGLTRHAAVKGFSSLFGSHHQFYGAMDFFYLRTYVNGFTPGLQNVYAGTSWSPVQAVKMDLAFHFFATAAKLIDSDKALGHMLEFTGQYKIVDGISLSLGYSFMYGTETMNVLKRSSDKNSLHWLWLMLRATPRIMQGK